MAERAPGGRDPTKGSPQVSPVAAGCHDPGTAGQDRRCRPVTEGNHVHVMHDGGGYAPISHLNNPERTQPVQHRTSSTDTLQSLAGQYSVSPEAILQLNPRLDGGNALPQGELINIPPPPQSVTDEIDAGSPTHSTTDISFSGSGKYGGVTWKPDSASIKLTDKQKQELDSSRGDGVPVAADGFSVTMASEASVTFTASESDTHTSFSLTREFNASLSGEFRAGGVRGLDGEGSVSTGVTSTYKVSLPGEASVEQAVAIDPFDPTTIPVGASVTIDGGAFVNTSLEASFRYIGMQTGIKDASGVSYSIERVDGNTVRVTSGPTETINAFNGAGFRYGDASLMAGREDQLHGASLQTAEFDISTPEGQAALEHFNATGQIAHETPGVSNVATITRIDFSSQSQLRAELGPLKLVAGGEANLGSTVQITYPDGSYSLTTDLSYGDNVPLTVEQRFDADGNELPGERSYTFAIQVDGNNEQLLNAVLTGGINGDGPVKQGDTAQLTFTEQEMQALIGQTGDAVDTYVTGAPDLRVLVEDYSGNRNVEPMDFAVSLARNLNSDSYGFVEKLFSISSAADGDLVNGYEQIQARLEVSTP